MKELHVEAQAQTTEIMTFEPNYMYITADLTLQTQEYALITESLGRS